MASSTDHLGVYFSRHRPSFLSRRPTPASTFAFSRCAAQGPAPGSFAAASAALNTPPELPPPFPLNLVTHIHCNHSISPIQTFTITLQYILLIHSHSLFSRLKLLFLLPAAMSATIPPACRIRRGLVLWSEDEPSWRGPQHHLRDSDPVPGVRAGQEGLEV